MGRKNTTTTSAVTKRVLLLMLAAALILPAWNPPASVVQDSEDRGICHPAPNDPDPMPDDVSHDHNDPAQHDLKCGLQIVDYEDLQSVVPEATMFGEVDVQGALGAIAVAFKNGGFVLFDLANPRDPQPLSRFTPPGCDQPDADCGSDVKLRPDGQVAFVSTQSNTRGNKAGIFTVNISDPRNPQLDHFLPIGEVGVHMVSYHEIGGQGYVFAIRNGFGVSIARVGVTRGKTTLTPVTEIQTGGQHDVFLYDDPVESKTFLYVSAEMGGWKIYDVTNPAAPAQVGEWNPPIARQGARWYAHNAWTWRSGDKRYTFVGPESVALIPLHGEIATNVWLLDTTDHANIKLLGTWKNPTDRPGGNIGFSAHNIWMAEDGIFWVAHYHGGVWLLDWRDAMAGKSRTAEELGYIVPNRSTRQTIARGDLGFYSQLDFFRKPMIWDVVLKDGLAYASDMNGGLYVLERESPEELKKLEAKKRSSTSEAGPLVLVAAGLAGAVLVILLIKVSAGKTGPGG